MKKQWKDNKQNQYTIHLTISLKAMQQLRELQQLIGAENIAEVIVSSIKQYKFLAEANAKGFDTLISKEGYKTRQIVWSKK